MGALGISNGVLNQKGSPAIYTDVYANRPAAGFNGRLFVSTDTSQIFEDNGTSWILIANSGIGSTGTLQVVTTNGNTTNTGITITAGGLTTNAITQASLTSGSVIFSGTGGLLSQDNTNLYWDNTLKRLGIGPTGGPTATLDIHSTDAVMIQLNNTTTADSKIAFLNAGIGKWRIGNLYSAGANTFHIYNNTTAGNALTITAANVTTFTGAVTAASLAIAGGTSSQFLKANGTTDSTAYISLASLSATSPLVYNNATGAFTILQSGSTQSGYLSSTDWTTFNSKASLASFSATTPLAYNSGTGAFTIQVANSGQSGYLTSTDWNTFNGKQSALTFGNLTESTSSVLTIAGGTGAVIGSGTTIQIKQSSASQNGYLSSTDWTTFNSKQAQINGTGFVKASGTTISYDNSTYYLASNPSNYITLASLSGTTPISYNTGTGAISIALANTSTSGYLSSTDWNTFNSKASLTAFSASPPLSYNSGTGAFSITQSSASTNGYLSSTDWSTFNSKQSALTNPVTGTGTINTIVKFTASGTSVGNSIITESGSAISIAGSVSANTTLNVRTSITSAGTAGSPYYDEAIIIGQTNNQNKIQYGNSFADNNGTWLRFVVNSSSAINTPIYPLTLKYDGSATFISSVGIVGAAGTNGSKLFVQGSTSCLFDAAGTRGISFYPSQSSIHLITSDYIGTSYYPLALSARGVASDLYINTNGNVLVGTTTDSGQGVLQVSGGITAGGISLTGEVLSASATLNKGYYHLFTGSTSQTLTLPSPLNNNYQYTIINTTANAVTIAAATSTNIVNLVGTQVASFTLIANARCFIIADGSTKYYQVF